VSLLKNRRKLVGNALAFSWVERLRMDPSETKAPWLCSPEGAMQHSIYCRATVLPDNDFFLVVLSAPLRVKCHSNLAAPAFYKYPLPLVVDRKVCDNLLGEAVSPRQAIRRRALNSKV
jgi:hypothetical protein